VDGSVNMVESRRFENADGLQARRAVGREHPRFTRVIRASGGLRIAWPRSQSLRQKASEKWFRLLRDSSPTFATGERF